MMPGHFDPWTIVFSFAIAALAAFASFEAASQTRRSPRPSLWVTLSATTLGLGIWSMHFIGMLAWKPPFPLFYNLPRTALSMLVSIVACGFAMKIAEMQKLQKTQNGPSSRPLLALCSLLVGGGICTMHYVGMSALAFNAPLTYDLRWLVASVAIAIAASFGALTMLRLSHEDRMNAGRQIAASAVLAFAVTGMHYTAMCAILLPAGAVCLWHPGDFTGMELARAGVGNALLFIIALLVYAHRDRVRLMHEANEAEVDAHEAFRQVERLGTIGKIAASVSHEINNPLDTVVNLLWLIEQGELNTEQRHFVGLAHGELQRIKEIVQHTLNFYRTSSEPVTTELPDLFDSALLVFDRRLRSAGIVVEKQWESGTPPIKCRAGEIRQVLANLIGNAIDAMPAGGHLSLAVRASDQGAQVDVTDTGSGITEDRRARILEPFFTTKGDRGTGLGLSVSAEILQRHGGTLRFTTSTEPGKSGTRFSLWLPTQLPV